jgi:GDP-mannose 6-dehydrogenase
MDPPFTLIGTDDEWVAESVTALYSMLSAPVMVVPFKVAEMVKYVNNAFHALKVCFGNEVGRLCRRLEIDSHQVMDIFCKDTKLNLSEYYLKPGFAFGGSCLPKDLRALLHHSRHLDVSLPVLESVLPSNDRQINVACRMVEGTERKRVGVCGLSFKAGTDDLRESPMVRLIEYLLGKGYPVKVYDENVSLSQLNGANRAYIEQTIPHIACLLADKPDDVLDWSDVIVLGNRSRQFESRMADLTPNQSVIDLVRVPLDRTALNGNYHGICW